MGGRGGAALSNAGGTDAAILRAYRALRTEPRGWVSLTDLRTRLAGHSRNEVDAALVRMNRIKGINVIPESNQALLTPQDRLAMVRIGGEDKLLLSIDETIR